VQAAFDLHLQRAGLEIRLAISGLKRRLRDFPPSSCWQEQRGLNPVPQDRLPGDQVLQILGVMEVSTGAPLTRTLARESDSYRADAEHNCLPALKRSCVPQFRRDSLHAVTPAQPVCGQIFIYTGVVSRLTSSPGNGGLDHLKEMRHKTVPLRKSIENTRIARRRSRTRGFLASFIRAAFPEP
jgi:hypothetical protein